MEITYDWSFTLTVTPCFDTSTMPQSSRKSEPRPCHPSFLTQEQGAPSCPIRGPRGLYRLNLIRLKVEQARFALCLCEGRGQIYRAGEAADGDDRLAPDDIRTMSVKFTANGERRRGFRDTVDEFTVTEMEGFPCEPRTCLPYLQAIKSVAESTYGQRLAWRQQSRIPEGSRAVYEDEPLSHILDTAISMTACLSLTWHAANWWFGVSNLLPRLIHSRSLVGKPIQARRGHCRACLDRACGQENAG